jgi:hypothetical protein
MNFQDILNEFEINPNDSHYQDRTVQRFFGQDFFDVVITPKTSNYVEPQIIGKFRIPPDVKSKIQSILIQLEKPYYVGEHGTAFIVELYEFHITPENIVFNGDAKQQQINKQLFYNNNHYLQERPLPGELQTKQNLSRGFYLICYIINNNLRSILFVRTTNPNDLKQKLLRTHPRHNIVFIKDPFTELDAYMDIDKAKEVQEPQPQEQPPPPPTDEPQLTNKERRLLAYKEKYDRLYGKPK